MERIPEHIEQSIKLAEKIVGLQLKIARLKEKDAPQVIIDDQNNLLTKLQAELLNDPLAEKLLPQAKVVVEARNKREEAITEHHLGILAHALDDSSASQRKNPFTNQTDSEAWEKFLSGLDDFNRKKITNSIRALIMSSIFELSRIELPPAPPDYNLSD